MFIFTKTKTNEVQQVKRDLDLFGELFFKDNTNSEGSKILYDYFWYENEIQQDSDSETEENVNVII